MRQSATLTEISATCTLADQPSEDPSIMEQLEALENPRACACGDVSGNPNNVYGWGEINALEAVKLALEWK